MDVKPMMKQFLAWLNRFFGNASQSETVARSTLEMLAMTRDHELTCDEVHALIDQFAEMHQRGENPAHLFPLVQLHLDMCPDCREEYEALLEALKFTPS
jgi:hypothetical protein